MEVVQAVQQPNGELVATAPEEAAADKAETPSETVAVDEDHPTQKRMCWSFKSTLTALPLCWPLREPVKVNSSCRIPLQLLCSKQLLASALMLRLSPFTGQQASNKVPSGLQRLRQQCVHSCARCSPASC